MAPTAFLIIMAALDDAPHGTSRMRALAHGMDVLIEIHERAELDRGPETSLADDRRSTTAICAPSRPRSRPARHWRR